MEEALSGKGSSERATCPVCSCQIDFRDINGHIDLCLGRRQQPTLPLLSGGDEQVHRSKHSSNQVSTSTSSPVVSPTIHGMSHGKQSLLRKRELSTGSTSCGVSHLTGKRRKRSSPAQASTSSTKLAKNVLHPTPSSAQAFPPFLPSPLPDMVRPANLTDYMGQEHVVGGNSLLRTAIESGRIPSLVFWGPPGCGKTTLARILARAAHEKMGAKFVQFSAACSGVGEIKAAVKVARNDKMMFKRQTVLFIDEIHQFNKLQQDAFLPHVEDGTITLLGATTENPSFKLNSALLSRCKVIVLKKLLPEDVQRILRNAVRVLMEVKEGEWGVRNEQKMEENVELRTGHEREGGRAMIHGPVVIEDDAITLLSEFCDGDARRALNALQITLEAAESRQLCVSKDSNSTETLVVTSAGEVSEYRASQQVRVTVADAKESLQCTHLLYDRVGEEHYNCISALHKSLRGSHASAALYWLARMLCAGEDPLYVARRIVRFASEDVGLADPAALQLAVSTYNACQAVGMPECEVVLAQAVVYMARAPKSIEVYRAYGRAVACIREHCGPQPSVPLHLRNASTKLMKDLGYGMGYQYNPDFTEPVDQQYLPDGLQDTDFFELYINK